MARRNHRHSPAPGAASWWLLLALVLVASLGFYVWYQQNRVTTPAPPLIQVAVADSSGALPAPDTISHIPGRDEGTTTIGPLPADTGPFIAPSPDFRKSSEVPVGNVLDYARRMRFDPSRGGELTLPVDEYARKRVVQLEPLANLRRLDSTAFAEGRIIARVRSEAALPAVSIHNGENFIWVQGTLGDPIQAEVWSTSVVVPPKILRLIYSPRPPAAAPEGKDAFWLGDSNNLSLWIACGLGWCHT